MYGLIGVFILAIMLAVLSVVTDSGIPDNLLLLNISPIFFGTPFLIIIATVFIFIHQHNALGRISAHSVVSHRASSIVLRTIRYVLMAILTGILIVGSALQVLHHHKQAELTKISQTMRVKAWVTIEGISDSVYDLEANSGYRQVATIRSISPLVANLTAQDLTAATADHLAAHSTARSVKQDFENTTADNTQYRILLNAYPNNKKNAEKLDSTNHLKPGDQLFMSLTLAPLKTSQQTIDNASGFDSYRWLRARHIDGVATVIAVGAPINGTDNASLLMTASGSYTNSYLYRLRTTIDKGRWQLRQHFYQDWAQYSSAQQQARAVTLSLLTGDRSLINRETKDLYQLAGISHLLAISGTHVLFLAIVLASLASLLCDKKLSRLYRRIPRWQVRWWVMIGAAFIYALFTGFDVPAARTAWMLLAIGLVRLTLLPISTMRVLLALAIIMAWQDSYVLWQAGYWLSFIAVALLLKYDDASPLITNNISEGSQPYNHSDNHNHNQNHRRRTQLWSLFKRVFKLQCWLFIALLPITLLLFGKVSLWGLVINLFAIGLFGWVIVPLNLLAGLCYLIAPVVADSIWTVVSAIVATLHTLLVWLTSFPSLKGAWLYTPINTGMLMMAFLVMLPWLLPRGLLSRWLALPPLALLMMTVSANQQALSLTPTLYILPTADRYITAAVLQYPVDNESVDKENDNNKNDHKKTSASATVSWLFLADHRPTGTRTMPSSLTADTLSATLEQQLRTLSINRLEGIVVQTSVAALTAPLTHHLPNKKVKVKEKSTASSPELLPMTVSQLIQNLPTNQYWQAGRSERWSTRQQAYLHERLSEPKTLISAQRCEQGKTWQPPNGALTLQAITGWSQIDDDSVWDCALAIDSTIPIEVVQYNATNPQQSPQLAVQKLMQSTPPQPESSLKSIYKSRLILDVSTHPRGWQLWSLLCDAQPFALNSGSNSSSLNSNGAVQSITWLSHSAAQVSADILTAQNVDAVMTYDNQPLDIALSLASESQAE